MYINENPSYFLDCFITTEVPEEHIISDNRTFDFVLDNAWKPKWLRITALWYVPIYIAK